MSEMLSKRLRWGGGGGFVFFGGGSRKGGFVRTPRTPSGYGPGQARTQDFLKGGSKWKGKKLKINDHCQCTNHFGMGFGARLRAPEAERLCLVHSRSFL